MTRARGFTLIELLVAITVLAIVAVLGWRGLDSILRSRTQLTQQMEYTRGIQLAFAQMQNDLEQLAGAAVIGAARQNLVADNSRLVFIRLQSPENGATQLAVVSYRLRDGVLTRRESPPTRDMTQLEGLWQAAQSDTDSTPDVALQANVTAMNIRLWDSGAWVAPPNGTGNSTGNTVRGTATGLEMSLQLLNEPNPMVKVLLLGAI
ncbi:general secretion pathway protein J [Pseudoduganella flava]|uniref:General secretion pathway protein J n=1 Tax=Pseudoduganella flava TaxID=871742 RepID=A0A562PPM7_9BURK|nr:prepilin-type N-terminal cleavage/methylation domain-containing protein [Pseudoduganella flava]QGZ40687.1 prepilin-type N-terminal cleavage/methylation domain-containing protein [Pseudoduganella flava]TWI46140.1 general secretion pathway protein J [Pseudoduganella flava]